MARKCLLIAFLLALTLACYKEHQHQPDVASPTNNTSKSNQLKASGATSQEPIPKEDQSKAGSSNSVGTQVSLWSIDDAGRPRPLSIVPTQYTEMARLHKVQGTIYVEAFIDENGKVTSAKVVRGLNPDYGLNDACIRSALKSTFLPGVSNGVKVKSCITYPVVFKFDQSK